jgi:hypothetical protein
LDAEEVCGSTRIIEKFRIPADMYPDERSYFSPSGNRQLVPTAVEHGFGVDFFSALFAGRAGRVAEGSSWRSCAIEPAGAAIAGSKRLVWKSRFFTDDGHDSRDPSPSGVEQRHNGLNDFRIDDFGVAAGV